MSKISHCTEKKDFRTWSDIPQSQPQILPSSQHFDDQKRQSKGTGLAHYQRPSSLMCCCSLWAVCTQPLIPRHDRSSDETGHNQGGIDENQKPPSLEIALPTCAICPFPQDRSGTGCEPQAELTPLSQTRLFCRLFLGSFPWLANTSPIEPVQPLVRPQSLHLPRRALPLHHSV